jgi:hypothetical protein
VTGAMVREVEVEVERDFGRAEKRRGGEERVRSGARVSGKDDESRRVGDGRGWGWGGGWWCVPTGEREGEDK